MNGMNKAFLLTAALMIPFSGITLSSHGASSDCGPDMAAQGESCCPVKSECCCGGATDSAESLDYNVNAPTSHCGCEVQQPARLPSSDKEGVLRTLTKRNLSSGDSYAATQTGTSAENTLGVDPPGFQASIRLHLVLGRLLT